MRRATILLAVLATSCVSPDRPGVVMDQVTADLAFGVPTPTPNAGPVFPPAPPTPGSPAPSPSPSITFTPPPTPSCPVAPPTEFPDREAPLRMDGAPEPGTYRWMTQGEQRIAGFPAALRIDRAATRRVHAVATDQLGRVSHSITGDEARLDDPDTVTSSYRADADGLSLLAIEREAGADFRPAAPLLIFPVPATPGDQIDAVGVDPATLTSIRYAGTVVGRQRVDACGELIEGWLVDGERTISAPGAAPVREDYDYVVATQWAGLIVLERVETPCTQSSASGCEPRGDLRYTARIGSLEPSRSAV